MQLSGVSFRYSRRGPWVLRNVDLDLHAGSVVEVTGRNGAGKSTLLRLLAGIVRPSRGSVAGRPPVVGYAPEVFPVDQPFTVAAYLAHMARARRVSPAAGTALAERLGAARLLGLPLGDLSKGSAQKVGLIQALLAPPGLLILDEPFAGLDEQTRAELPEIIEEVASGGGAVVVSDHQNQLRGFPGARRWLVADAAVAALDGERPPRAGAEAGRAAYPVIGRNGDRAPKPDAEDDGERERHAVIEVIVDADEADEVEQKLRADGYLTRRTA
ncbi:ABC transporter ATP-binding protein [Planomonospora sp. ID67723]|uniref:ABC transporter ATP-binding protein n=1 Tax=Planomonospora sp. ID67723 TaxID=2738134 RepID=UPI001E2FD47F|nr:ABC transporter ATP-binding protein [Planomonospora sp. ID67723]